MNVSRFAAYTIILSVAILTTMAMTGCGSKKAIDHDGKETPFVNWYLDKGQWTEMLRGYVGEDNILEFLTTRNNIVDANEVNSFPDSNFSLGPIISFDSAVIDFPFSFYLRTLAGSHNLVYDDREGTELDPVWPEGFRERAISIGDVNDHEDDDFEIAITESDPNYKVVAIGFEIIDNSAEDGEYSRILSIENSTDTILDTTSFAPVESSSGGIFFGIVSSRPISKFIFNESSLANDDIAIRDFYFAVARK
jgi:hypothetical protein